jgi:hypothetical protein
MGCKGTLCAVSARLAVAGLSLLAGGCGSIAGAPSPVGEEETVTPGIAIDGSTNEPRGRNVPVGVDAKSPFLKAVPVTVGASTLTIEGTITTPDDVDIYDIGPVFAGDSLVVDAHALADLDPVAAVFDADENLVQANDDRAYYAQLTDPKIQVQIRHDADPCYVAIASSFATGTTGEYTLELTRTPGPPPEPNGPQVIFFNFDGAEAIRIGTRSPVDVPPFEGSLIAPEFADQTEDLIARILEFVREDYIGLDVTFISSREGSPPADPYTTIHFGAYDPDLLGVADNVDEYNYQLRQTAIVFVDTFQAFLPLEPTVDEMAHALANVAAHETGHLLGLQHTHEPRGIMDISANLRQMMANQAFLRSPLDPYVFPVGYQDAAQLLVESVGGDLTLVKMASLQQISMRAVYDYDVPGPPARATLTFGTCFCPSCLKAQHTGSRKGDESNY